ncbi:hypothetical protein [Denitrificimonas caeni]|uniref:Uncharacterized protein n=1 Tax=Denitrificimonas caeni TaxID=521720 RepID=A0AAF0AK39_9GAMM|nr:hypothetical protein [Denitrificimonas caeni]WBE25061.1 hypothetical protein O6P33_11975 [Denitrificimonas caeni]
MGITDTQALNEAEAAISEVAFAELIANSIIKRRFKSGLELFHSHYKQAVNQWLLYDNSTETKVLLERGDNL